LVLSPLSPDRGWRLSFFSSQAPAVFSPLCFRAIVFLLAGPFPSCHCVLASPQGNSFPLNKLRSFSRPVLPAEDVPFQVCASNCAENSCLSSGFHGFPGYLFLFLPAFHVFSVVFCVFYLCWCLPLFPLCWTYTRLFFACTLSPPFFCFTRTIFAFPFRRPVSVFALVPPPPLTTTLSCF